MLNYNEAKKIALENLKTANACQEFKEAYLFYDKDYDGDGGGRVVILKENGKALSWVSFILDYHPEKNPKEINF